MLSHVLSQLLAQLARALIVSRTHALQASCVGVGSNVTPVHGLKLQVSVLVTICVVSSIDPEESTINEIRFFTGCATAMAVSEHDTKATTTAMRWEERMRTPRLDLLASALALAPCAL